MKHIKDAESFNLGLQMSLLVLRQHFFAGNLEGGEAAIKQIEKMFVTHVDNGVFSDMVLPDSVKEIHVESMDILEEV